MNFRTALSARVSALEAAVHALAQGLQLDWAKALAVFDALGREMLDRYGALPVDEGVLELLEQSFADVRQLLTSD